MHLGLVFQLALHALVGAAVLALAVVEFARRPKADDALLLAWVLGTFVFAAFVNWTVSARTLVPVTPALGILIGRRLVRLRTRSWVWFLPLVPAFLLAVVVAHEDLQMAAAAKSAAVAIRARLGSSARPVWFQGHWGFQYYMEGYGFRPLDRDHAGVQAGDIVVRPSYNTNLFAIDERRLHRLDTLVQPARFVAVMDVVAGAGFYSSLSGPLAYVFGGTQPMRYEIDEVAPAGPSHWPADP